MQFFPIKTRAFLPPKDDIYQLIDESIENLQDGDVLVITSKILGIHQGRTVKIKEDTTEEKDKLIYKEADKYIPRNEVPGEYAVLTIKDNTLVASSGIDKSNANGYYVLWPENTNELCKEIVKYLKDKFKIKNLAVISVDSHFIPLRYGATGISTGFWGLEPVIDKRGTKDIFGRELKFTRTNVIDSLAAIAVLLIGEGAESTPMLIIRGAEMVTFSERDTYRDLIIPEGEDMYTPILEKFNDSRPKN